MPLSAEEQRRLAELEETLSTDDLDFARSFSRRASATCPHPSRNALEQRRMQHRRARRRQILLGSVMVLLGLAGVVGGVVLTSGVLAVVGFAIMALAVGVLLSTGGGVMPRSSGVRPRGGQREPHSESFTARMEERWRRRQSR
ncbi:DUF3040 domain-containing protein [Cutibacterium acnes]|uniref:DUF3040 domain-containing protein n=1 Tax=Cutibacterium TaxID=1912216 RepID=UPI0001EF2868|nr:DUF3040 domain-containing protein [Cutibacterium acnes]EFS55992.1 hypothetical protein HMPREF9593_00954 [Cutibacterium acnes HL046PA2]EFS60865.1 hypothetical protein HMPREF9605_02263 [Cutibacterium acnes HL036PA2]EFS89293.1 hypothetical protein HMPREF9606_01626 [Cutibacterium acnes HL036PA3]EFT04389.1 hypothetical protein HMPREF9614_02372 [Cutibacterium acnes HL002PA2]EFT57915.1 hypothetical protein HMPREF9615_02236 [Cutibacterium acnes HL002PA3]